MLFILELPQYPNVDAFNFETMKKMLIEKLDSFNSAPFTIQRICELLADPRKQYSRIDKFMRAVEKTILVVSTQEPGRHRSESENGDSLDSALNGDFASEVNVEIDMDSENSFSTKDFSATTAAIANRKDPNVDVTTTPTTKSTTTTPAADVTSVATVKAPETNGSTEKTTDPVPKTDAEEVKSETATEVAPATEAVPATEAIPATEAAPTTEAAPATETAPATEVASVTSSDSEASKASSSNSDTEVKKDEDKSPIEEKTEKKTEEKAVVAEEEEPESIEEEIPEEADEDDEEDDMLEIMVPVCDAELPGACDTTSKLPGDKSRLPEGYANMKEIIVTVSDPSVVAVVFPLAALESICKEQHENDIQTTTVKLEDFIDTSTRIISEDSTASDSPDESDSGIKRMKYTVSDLVSRPSAENSRSIITTTSASSTVVREEQLSQVGSTTTNAEEDEEDDDEEEEDKSQDLMSTGEATTSTTEDKDPEVEAKPMNEEVPTECAEAVAVASSSSSSSSSSIVSEMEASSSAAPVESKMSLDEDVTSEIAEESVPLVAVNKMDTVTEGDAMDVDESEASSESMDQ